MPGADLRERLREATSRVDVPQPNVERFVSRGRRRRARELIAAVIATTLVAGLSILTLGSLVSARHVRGAGALPAQATAKPARILTTRVGRNPNLVVPGRQVMWVTDANSKRPSIYRVDPTTGLVLSSEPLAGKPLSAVAVGEHAVVAIDGRRGLLEVTGRTADRTEPFGPQDEEPVAITKGFGAVWTVNKDGRVSKLDEVTGRELQRIGIAAPHGANVNYGIAQGAGRVWVVASSSGSVFAIDPASGQVRSGEIDPPAGPGGNASPSINSHLQTVAVAWDDVWVCCGSQQQLQRIDPETLAVDNEIGLDQLCGTTQNTLAGDGRGVWALTFCGGVRQHRSGSVMLISRGSGGPTGFVGVPYQTSPVAIGTGAGQIWIAATATSGAGVGYLDRFTSSAILQEAEGNGASSRWPLLPTIAIAGAILVILVALRITRNRRRRELTAS